MRTQVFASPACACLALAVIGLNLVCSQSQTPRLAVGLEATKPFQTVDGFGVNH